MTKNAFIKSVTKLLINHTRVLVLLRIPNSGNNRHYFFIENLNNLTDLINECNTSDSITVFKSIKEFKSGLITKDFIKGIVKSKKQDKFNSELLIVNSNYREYKTNKNTEWDVAENSKELEEILKDNLGTKTTIISEPDFCDESNTFHLYVPNKFGLSKPGKSY